MRKRRYPGGAEPEAIEAIYRERFPAFLRTAAAIVGDAEGARDAVQEAFARALRSRESYRGEGNLEAWLWRIVVNEARTGQRGARGVASGAAFEPSWSGGHGDPNDAAVRLSLAELPERQRLAVFLRYYADLEYEAIAEALEIRAGTVAATLNAAHAALRTRLEEVRT